MDIGRRELILTAAALSIAPGCASFGRSERKLGYAIVGLGRIDIQRSQIMAAARWTKPVKWMTRRS